MKNKKLLITAISLFLIPTCFITYKYTNYSINHSFEKNIINALSSIDDFKEKNNINIIDIIDDDELLSVVFKYKCYSAYAEFLKDENGNYLYSYSEMQKSNTPASGYVQRNISKNTPTKFIVYANCNNKSATKVRVTANGKSQEKRISPNKDNVVVFDIDNINNSILNIKTEFLNSQGTKICLKPLEESTCF